MAQTDQTSVAGGAAHDRYANIPYVSIEITSYCNRDCPFCPRNLDRLGVRKDANGDAVHKRMPTEQIFSLIDQLQLGGYRGEISFHMHSDPFLDKRYPQIARYAASRGLKVSESTNGDVLRQNSKLCEEIDGIVDPITIGLYDYRTYAEKLELMEFWKNRFKISTLRFSTPYENLNPRPNSELYEWQAKDERILNAPCLSRRDNLVIRYDGVSLLCCQDDYGAFGLGNVFEDGIDHVLFSLKRKRINDALDQANGRHKFKLCSTCYVGRIPKSEKSEEDIERDREKVRIQERFKQGSIDLEQMLTMSNDLDRVSAGIAPPAGNAAQKVKLFASANPAERE